MTIAHLLQDFGQTDLPGQTLAVLSETALEEQKLASFEQGYTAGWDDSITNQTESTGRLTESLSRSLEDISFTYQEAYQQMLSSVAPVFGAMVDHVLPEVMRSSVGQVVVEQARDLVGETSAMPLTLWVPPGTATQVRPVVVGAGGMDVRVEEDPTLGDGQICLRVGDYERELDTSVMLRDIRSAVEGFAHELKSEMPHG